MGDLIKYGDRADGGGAENHGVQCVGRVSFLFTHPLLKTLRTAVSAPDQLTQVGLNWNKITANGSVYLTGFKLESTLLNAQPMIDNAKVIPMLNGDTMTLTNTNKSGTITFAATRSAAGIGGGDLIAVCDFIRSQGDSNGGELLVSWEMNGETKWIKFKKVCVQKCPPLMLAGNDLPDMSVVLTYATYEDKDDPSRFVI